MSELTPGDDTARQATTRALFIALGIAVAGILLILFCGFIADLAGIGPSEEQPAAAEPAAAE